MPVLKYKNNYLKGCGLTKFDVILCENCGAVAVDIHHIIHKSQGGLDDYGNLIALCRDCHDKAHNKSGCKEFQQKLLMIANER